MVNQCMWVFLRFSTGCLKIYHVDLLFLYIPYKHRLSLKSLPEMHALDYCIKYEIHTPYTMYTGAAVKWLSRKWKVHNEKASIIRMSLNIVQINPLCKLLDIVQI